MNIDEALFKGNPSEAFGDPEVMKKIFQYMTTEEGALEMSKLFKNSTFREILKAELDKTIAGDKPSSPEKIYETVNDPSVKSKLVDP